MDPTTEMKWLHPDDAMKKIIARDLEREQAMTEEKGDIPPDVPAAGTIVPDPHGEWTLIYNGEKFYFQSDANDHKVMGFDVVGKLVASHPRFSGNAFADVGGRQHTWSVAHHLLHCMELVENPILKLLVGVHDAHEGFLHDIATPMKRILPDYAKLEKYVQKRFLDQHNLRWFYVQFEHKVAQIDKRALMIERSIFLPDHPEWPRTEVTADEIRRVLAIHESIDPAFSWSVKIAELYATLVPV